jgi:hypothetical protein
VANALSARKQYRSRATNDLIDVRDGSTCTICNGCAQGVVRVLRLAAAKRGIGACSPSFAVIERCSKLCLHMACWYSSCPLVTEAFAPSVSSRDYEEETNGFGVAKALFCLISDLPLRCYSTVFLYLPAHLPQSRSCIHLRDIVMV